MAFQALQKFTMAAGKSNRTMITHMKEFPRNSDRLFAMCWNNLYLSPAVDKLPVFRQTNILLLNNCHLNVGYFVNPDFFPHINFVIFHHSIHNYVWQRNFVQNILLKNFEHCFSNPEIFIPEELYSVLQHGESPVSTFRKQEFRTFLELF